MKPVPMSSRVARVALCVLAMLGAATSVRAESYRLDPATTKITFTLDTTLHLVHGTAQLASGRLELDPATSSLSGEVVIDARSLETGSRGRDEDMHAKVLESGRYPTITWRPERVVGALPANDSPTPCTLAGGLEIHGASHPMAIAGELRRQGAGYGLTATLAIPYVEWGMKDPSKFILSAAKVVNVTIEAVAVSAAADAAGATPPANR